MAVYTEVTDEAVDRRDARPLPRLRPFGAGWGRLPNAAGALGSGVHQLTSDRALRFHVQRVNRLTRRHEKPVALAAAKTNVRATFRQQNTSDQHTVGREHGDSVIGRTAGKSAPDVTVHIDPNAVRET